MIVHARESGGRGSSGGGLIQSTKIETKEIDLLGGRSVDVINYITDFYKKENPIYFTSGYNLNYSKYFKVRETINLLTLFGTDIHVIILFALNIEYLILKFFDKIFLF